MKRAVRPVIAALVIALAMPVFTAGVAEAAILDPPTLLTPVNGATPTANPTFTWSAVLGAGSYHFQASTNQGFSPLLLDSVTVNRNFTPTNDLPQGAIYWRVATRDAVGTEGAFSSSFSFTKGLPAAPSPVAPANNAVIAYPNDPLIFRWDPVPSARTYDIEVALDQAFTAPLVVQQNTVSNAFASLAPLTFGQTYYWHVRSQTAQGLPSLWSPTLTFQTVWSAVPQLTYPPDSQLPTIEEVYFTWNWLKGASSYDIQVSSDINFTTIAASASPKSSFWTAPNALPNGSYFWRVRGKTSGGAIGGWSAVRTFSKAWPGSGGVGNPRIVLLYPADGTTNVPMPSFRWTPFRRAARYEVQFSTDSSFATLSASCQTTHVELEGACFDPVPGTLYYWRVRPIDAPSNILGLFSLPFTFVYTGPTPVAVSPLNQEVMEAPILTWQPLGDVASYEVRVRAVSPPGPDRVYTTFANSFVPTDLVPPLTPADPIPYTWSVKAMTGGGLATGSSGGSFLHASPTPTAAPNPIGPPQTSDHVPNLQWTATTNPAFYKVEYRLQGVGASFVPLGEGLRSPSFTYPGNAVPPGTYEWRVTDGVTTGATSTFTVTSLPVVTGVNPPHCGVCSTLPDTPIFAWNPVPGADGYTLYLATDDQFTNIVGTYTARNSRYIPTAQLVDSQAGQAIYWYVRACYAGTHCSNGPETFGGAQPPIRAYRKQSSAVKTISPGVDDGSTPPIVPDQPFFQWEDYLATNLANNAAASCVQPLPPAMPQPRCAFQEAQNYVIQVSQFADFSVLLDQQTVDERFFTPMDRTYPEGPIYWRVYAIDGSNNVLPFSSTRHFIKQSPLLALTAPTAGQGLTTQPVFQWDQQNFAVQYQVEVYATSSPTGPISGSNLVLSVTTGNSFWVPQSTLIPGTYGWRVRRLDADGRPGPWTPNNTVSPSDPVVRLFTFTGTPAGLISPANGASIGNNDLLFQWSIPTGSIAATYQFQSSTTADFSNIFENAPATVMSSYAPVVAYPVGQYWWRIRVFDANGNLLSTSATSTFTRITPPPVAPSAPMTVTAAPGDSSAVVSWAPPLSDGGAPVTTYTVTSSPGNATCVWTSGPLSCTVANLLNGTSYTFTVRATNSAGTGPVSVASSAVVPRGVPGAPTGVTGVAGVQQVTVSWNAPASDGASPITSYRATASPGGAFCTWTAGPRTCVVTGLTNGIGYTFVVTATNAIGTGAGSTPSATVTPRTIPDAPSGVFGEPGNGEVVVSWSPGFDGGSPITSFRVTATPGGRTCTDTTGSQTCTVTGLTNGTAYTFRVTATNVAGTSPASDPSDPVTPLSVPGAPTGVVGAPGDGQVTITWAAPANTGGSAITGYTVTATPTGKTCSWSAGPRSCVITGLTNGTPYTFTVNATNIAGTGPESTPSAAVTPRTVAGAPSNVAGTFGDTQVTVTWSAPGSNGGAPVTQYRVTASPGGRTCTWTTGPLTCIVTGLTNGTPYTFTVVATNVAGPSAPSLPSAAITPAKVPGAPATITAVAGNGQATVTWTAPSSNGGAAITGYTVTSSPGAKTCTWTTGPLTCIVTGLTNGTAHTFTVVARNVAGTGPASAASSPVTPVAPPGPPTAVVGTSGDGQVTVVWTAPAVNGGATITGYTVTAAPGGQTCTWTAGPLTCTVTGLTNETTYTFTVKATNSAGPGAASAPSAGVAPRVPGPRFHAVSPQRILDTRPGPEQKGLAGKFGPQQSRVLQVTGNGGVPAGASAVVLNVTAVSPSADSFLSVTPDPPTLPVNTSSLNLAPGTVRPNLVVAKLNAQGRISIYNNSGQVDVLADVVGWFDDGTIAGDLITSVTPSRILDTRPGPGQTGLSGKFGPQQARVLQVAGKGGVPAGATAVVLNVTSVNPSLDSFVSLTPDTLSPGQVPTTSNLNLAAGKVIPNLVVVKLNGLGQVTIYNNSGQVDLLADVVGFASATPGGTVQTLTPSRILDTRPGPDQIGLAGKFGPAQARVLQVSGQGGVPVGASAVWLNVTSVNPSADSFLTLTPQTLAPGQVPTTSNLNLAAGKVVPNLVLVKLNASGQVTIYNNSGQVDVLADVVAYIR